MDEAGADQGRPSGEAPSPFARAAQLLADQASTGMRALAGAADRLEAASPDLTRVLRSSAIRVHLEAYPRWSDEANAPRRRLFREVTAANICLLLTGVLSGLVLAETARPWLEQATGIPHPARWLGLATLVLGGAAAMLGYQARENDRLRRWLTLRANAEMERLAAFEAIAAGAVRAGPGAAGVALALVCRHLLDDQRRGLIDRAKRHRRSSGWTNLWGGLATALAFVGGSGAVIASFQADQIWITLVGVVGAALGAYALGREGLNRDRGNADRYEKAAVALDELAGRVDAVAEEITAGNLESLTAFVAAISAQLATEHKQWLEGTVQAESVLAALDARLQEIGANAARAAADRTAAEPLPPRSDG